MAEDIESMFNEILAADDGSGNDSTGVDDTITGMTGATVELGDDIESDDDTESVDDGGTEEDSEDTDDDGTPSDSSFDWATHKDQLVTIKVQGQEIQVPLGEALNGYMRQADYTKKTQSNAEALKMAEWAAQLREAINSDPAGTIKYLQDAYGVKPAVTNDFDDIDPELKPILDTVEAQKRQLAAVQAQLDEARAERILNEVRNELREVQQEFPDLVPETVLPVAAEKGLSIREAYLLMESQSILNTRKSASQAAADAEKIAEREAAKRRMAKQTGKTSTVAGQAKNPMPRFDSFEDMLNWNIENAKTLS